MSDARRDSWERRGEIPLLIASVVFMIAYAVPILAPGLSTEQRLAWRAVSWSTWLLFAVDYAVRLLRAPRRWVFVRTNWLDGLVLALPMLRPLRTLRVLTALRQVHRRLPLGFRGQVMVYAGATTALLGFGASLALLQAERGHPGASIQNFGDAVWCMFTTMTTVGYGDTYPVTVQGRVVAVGLMTCGVALLGVVTATFASWFVSRFDTGEKTDGRSSERLLEELTEEVRALRAERSGPARGAR